jgi:hypothetical protein
MKKLYYQIGVHAGSQNLNMSSRMGWTRFQRSMFCTLILELGKWFVDRGSRLLRCSLLPVAVWCTHQLMSYALDGGKLLVPTLWNWVLTRCCASRPDAEKRSCTFLDLFIDGDTASCFCSSGLFENGVVSKLSVNIYWNFHCCTVLQSGF